MIDTLGKIGPLVVSCLGALIAFLVYRLNSEKLFLDMLSTRREAMREVLDAAAAREREAQMVNAYHLATAQLELPEQSRFWRAINTATGLFGPEVERSMDALDNALREVALAKLDVRVETNPLPVDNRHWERIASAGKAVEEARAGFIEATRPYINLGRRGLPILDRARLLKRRRQKTGARQPWFKLLSGSRKHRS